MDVEQVILSNIWDIRLIFGIYLTDLELNRLSEQHNMKTVG